MTVLFRRYSDQIIIVLVMIILILLLILFTDVHVAKINREIQQTIHQSF